MSSSKDYNTNVKIMDGISTPNSHKIFRATSFLSLTIKHDYCKNPSIIHLKENDRTSQHYAADLHLSPFSSCAPIYYFYFKKKNKRETKRLKIKINYYMIVVQGAIYIR